MASNEGAQKKSAPPRPTIALPPRDNLFFRGANASPGPMTLVSSFFSESEPESDCRSFSQLLAGAMASPGVRWPKAGSDNSTKSDPSRVDGPKEESLHSKQGQSRPMGLVMAHSPGMFTIPPGLSPTSLLDSPGFFSSTQGHFGVISHQQALAQVTAQASQSQSQMQFQTDYSSSVTPPMFASNSFSTNPADTTLRHQQTPALTSDEKTIPVETAEASNSDQRSQFSHVAADRPADDGYNWRKYGQKQVKGSEYPRSYYKCSHSNCPVKKKVERSFDGQVTEIIYKGQHNHQPPQPNKRAKEGGHLPSGPADQNERTDLSMNTEIISQGHAGNFCQSDEIVAAPSAKRDLESGQITCEQLSGSSDGEDVGDAEVGNDAADDSKPDPKRRHIDVRVAESSSSHRTVTEPRIIVQTTSEVDLLDDGYRWRKYGQKVVKGNPNPRSYYKCTNAGCNVRKHVERASGDPKAVITTYEGKHNHDVPVAKNSSHNIATSAAAINSAQQKPHNAIADKNSSVKGVDYRNDRIQKSVSLVQLKEER